MESKQRREHDEASQRYLEKIAPTYILDGASGIYKPQSDNAKQDAEKPQHGSHYSRPFWVNVIRDWPVFLVSIGTLILLILTVHYARKQWFETIRTADASIKAADAAASAALTAHDSLALSRQEFASGEAAVLLPNVSIRESPKGAFIQIDIINTGHIAATRVDAFIATSNHASIKITGATVTSHSASPEYQTGFITRTVPIPTPVDYQALANAKLKTTVSLAYWSGVDLIKSRFCYSFLYSNGRPYWEECENQNSLQ